MSIGKKIRELREERNWSQGDLEKQSGIDRRTISQYEREVNEPTISMAKKIASGFDVSIDYLASDEYLDITLNDKALFKLCREVDKLAPKYRRVCKEVLSAIIVKSEND